MVLNRLQFLLVGLLMGLFFSCTGERKKIVAVSQCSMDEWRNQMNEEMQREAFFHTDLDVEIHSTPDNTQQQIADIESFIRRGVDAIVVAPNEWKPLRPVIEKAYDSGIPVVLIDRKINSDKYTAFVGGDNVDVGRKAAHYIRDLLPHGGTIIEIEGLASSTSSQERKQGLHEVLDSLPDIRIVADVVANWQRQRAFDVMDSISPYIANEPVDIVFAYNDRMAIGARAAFVASKTTEKLPAFCGIDALAIPDGGIEHILSIDTHGVEYLGQLIDKSDIHIALAILYYLRGLGHLDGGGLVGTVEKHRVVEGIDEVSGLGRGAGGHFLYRLHTVLLVAGIDTLGAVASIEVCI